MMAQASKRPVQLHDKDRSNTCDADPCVHEQAIKRQDFEAASKYLGSQYIQHNQMAADGLE